jgi:PKD repeat protein
VLAYDLAEFKGKKVIVEIEWVRGFNNWTYVDNISIREKDANTKRTDFTISQNPSCFNKTIIFDDTTEIAPSSIRWDFGTGTGVRYATGAGPFSIRYFNGGERKIIYKLRSPEQDVILVKYLSLVPAAVPNFIFNIISGRTVAFEDRSANTQTYSWDFNDGTKSTEKNPIHTFDSSKLYRVKLTVSNLCGNPSKTVIVDLSTIVNTEETKKENKLNVFPNPGSGNYTVNLQGTIIEYQVYDLQGKKLLESTEEFRNEFPLQLGNSPEGSYFLRVKSDRGVFYTKIEKIR